MMDKLPEQELLEALARIEELEARELGFIQSLRELEKQVAELHSRNAELEAAICIHVREETSMGGIGETVANAESDEPDALAIRLFLYRANMLEE